MDSLEIVRIRVKELETLVGLTPENKSFTALARLTEAKHILELLRKNDV